jgi:hypothetical protein
MPQHCCAPQLQEVSSLGLSVNGLATMYVAGLILALAMLGQHIKGLSK